MLRLALTAYLCLATVIGPSLCCCAVSGRSRVGATRPHSCCDHSLVARATRNAAHRGVVPTSAVHPGAAAPDRSFPGRGDQQSCPCNHQRWGSIGTVTAKMTISVEPHETACSVQGSFLTPALVADVCDLWNRPKDRFLSGPPAELAGREILRAYQILLC